MAYELKTKPTDQSVLDFLNGMEHAKRKEDSLQLLDLFTDLTGEEPVMWGQSIIGFGKYAYTYASGHSGEWMATGFSPRKQNLSLYLMCGPIDDLQPLYDKLGKYKTGKSCLYINKLEDVDIDVLKELIRRSYETVIKQGGAC